MAKKHFSVFISHAMKDRDIADSLMKALRDKGLEVESDLNVAPGEDWAQAIKEEIDAANIVLLVISPDYLASQSSSFEAGIALSRADTAPDAKVIPVLVRGVQSSELPPLLKRAQAIDTAGIPKQRLAEKVGSIVAAALANFPERHAT